MSGHHKTHKVEDLRLKLNRMRDEREKESGGTDPPPDPGYNYLRDPSRDSQDHSHAGYRGRGHRYDDKRDYRARTKEVEYEDRRGSYRGNFHYEDRRGHRGNFNFHHYENRRGHRGNFHENEERRGNLHEYEESQAPHAHRESNTYPRGGTTHWRGKSDYVSENKAFINELNYGKPLNVKVEVQTDTGNRVYSCDENQTFDYRGVRGDRRGHREPRRGRGRFHDNVHHSERGSRARGYRPRGRGFYRGRNFSRGRRGGENPSHAEHDQSTEANAESEIDNVLQGLNTLKLQEHRDVEESERNHYENNEEAEFYEYDGEHYDNEEYHDENFQSTCDDTKDKEVISKISLGDDKEQCKKEKQKMDSKGKCENSEKGNQEKKEK